MARHIDSNNLACPTCSQPMRISHVTPKQAGLPELKSFRCFFCTEVVTKAVEDI
jgi:hypothetical protein